jgi:hypothetical protein
MQSFDVFGKHLTTSDLFQNCDGKDTCDKPYTYKTNRKYLHGILLSLALYSSRLPGKFLFPNILRFSIISFAGSSIEAWFEIFAYTSCETWLKSYR